MIKNINFLGKPSKGKSSLFIPIGFFLFSLGLIDVTLKFSF